MNLTFRIFFINLMKDQIRSRLEIKDAVKKIPGIVEVL